MLIDSSVIQRYDSDDTLEKCLKVIVLVGVGVQQSLSVTISAGGSKGAAEFVTDNEC